MASSEVLKDWLVTFWRILIAPSPKTFVEEAEKAKDKFASAVGWAVFIALYSYLLGALAGTAFNVVLLVAIIIVFPLALVLIPSVAHFMLQRVFHRKQYLYDKVLYVYTAIFVVFQLIINLTFSLPANIRPIVNYLFIVYQFILLVIAVKAIAEIRYWQAAVTALFSIFAGILVLICALPVIIALMSSVARVLR